MVEATPVAGSAGADARREAAPARVAAAAGTERAADGAVLPLQGQARVVSDFPVADLARYEAGVMLAD